MRLIIDIGNTNVKIAVFNNNALLKKIIYNKKLQTFFAKIFKDYEEIKHVLCCGGNDELQNNIENIISNYDVVFMKWKNVKKNIIEIEYNNNDTLGFDRIGIAVATSVLYPKFKNHLVIDIGTCITYDFISQKKYKGGQISPGINMRLKALNMYTNDLPNLTFSIPKNLVGNSTEECIYSGVFFGVFYEMKSIINVYKKKYPKLNVVITGGDTMYFKKTIKNIKFDDNLLMKGLNLVLDYNIEK